MSQVTLEKYFLTRKRTAQEPIKQTSAKKVLIVEKNSVDVKFKCPAASLKGQERDDHRKVIIVNEESTRNKSVVKHEFKTELDMGVFKTNSDVPNELIHKELNDKCVKNNETEARDVVDREELCKTPPASPVKTVNALDKIKPLGKELNFLEIKQKMSRSSRLSQLKASLNKIKRLDNQLKVAEKRDLKGEDKSVNLKDFKKIELEVTLSPQKSQSPQKLYLSPKKDTSARKNLLNLLSPTKNAVSLPSRRVLFKEEQLSSSFILPPKYSNLIEIFRCLDVASQIMYNRSETITYRKLKPAVEEMLKRNLYESHLAQIKKIYPEAYCFSQEKLRVFGEGVRRERWELVVKPNITQEAMSSDMLLERRQKLKGILLEKVSVFHDEFLKTLNIKIAKKDLRRWHPEFDHTSVPDIEFDELPQQPEQEKATSAKEVLERARELFKCNNRMEQALERLKAKQGQDIKVEKKEEKPNSLLKGIPKSILERVRQKQAARALENMTRSSSKEKEVELYSRLPELARLTRNLFVSEKKNVLPMDSVIEKLTNSFKTFMIRGDLEDHIKILGKEAPDFLALHEVRTATYVKVSKDKDLSLVISRLEAATKEKIES